MLQASRKTARKFAICRLLVEIDGSLQIKSEPNQQVSEEYLPSCHEICNVFTWSEVFTLLIYSSRGWYPIAWNAGVRLLWIWETCIIFLKLGLTLWLRELPISRLYTLKKISKWHLMYAKYCKKEWHGLSSKNLTLSLIYTLSDASAADGFLKT